MILPGATVGVLGSGQLGRMFAIAARRLGYRVHTLSPDDDTPTGQVADVEVAAPYEDLDAVRAFAQAVDVVTFEFENVPSATAAAAAEHVPVRPSGDVLHVTQHRGREKAFLVEAGIPCAPHARVRSLPELEAAVARLGCPSVLKTAGWGYDGKGQTKLLKPSDAASAWTRLGPPSSRRDGEVASSTVAGATPSLFPSSRTSDCERSEPHTADAVLEGWVEFEREVSVIGARGLDGSFVHFGPFANDHAHHILDVSVAPAPIGAKAAQDAVELTRAVLERLDVVGVLCVEMFLLPGGRLLVNELAPRPHNSGHLTVDAHVTSQFEQQLRAICGLPLGSTELLRPAAMANLLGDLWTDGPPAWERALALPDVKLHLYGKVAARPGRKMGHLTALAADAATARARVLAARDALRRG